MNPSRRALILAFVAVWILLGPIAMAFGGCLLMGDCEALCGTVPGLHLASSLFAVALVWSLALVGSIGVPLTDAVRVATAEAAPKPNPFAGTWRRVDSRSGGGRAPRWSR